MTEKLTDKQDGPGGLRLRRFQAITAVLIALLAFLLLVSTYRTSKGYSRMVEATDRYISSQKAATNMQAASDYLTAQARAFIATGDLAHTQLFFEETDVVRRRDHALEDIGEYFDNSPTLTYLSAALDCSNELLKIECYAMRLAAESYGYDPSVLPEKLRNVALLDSDLLLSAEAQRDRALMMVFDETYQDYKNQIRDYTSRSVEVMIEKTRAQQIESSEHLLKLIRREAFTIVVMLLMALLLVLSTAFLVSRPLQSYVRHIRLDEPLPEVGASELRFLARTYNQVREQNLLHHEQLTYDATHDALTGVFNRSVFEKLRMRFNERDIALLIIDLDKFKSINDTYGHNIGDRALCYVAALLQENFRAEDYICRIGGDEFVIVMVHTGSALRELVENKIRHINGILAIPKGGLPPISLSVGVAFGDRENPTDDIFNDADTALYRAKSTRLGGCEFY